MRNLEREIASICRKLARKVVAKEIEDRSSSTPAKVVELLGVPRYHLPSEKEREAEIGRGHGAGLDRGRRRDPDHRGDDDARPREVDADRPAGRRDAGVGPGGDVLHPQPGRDAGHRPAVPPQVRHPRAHPRGGDPQGRPVGRHRDGHRDRLAAEPRFR